MLLGKKKRIFKCKKSEIRFLFININICFRNINDIDVRFKILEFLEKAWGKYFKIGIGKDYINFNFMENSFNW